MSDELVRIDIHEESSFKTAIVAARQAVNFNVCHRWDEIVRYEQEVCREVFAHPDAAEGPLAFTEKREPRFSDQ